jgi:S1-C subfamily serine protease
MRHTPTFGVISFLSLLASFASLSRADEVADKGREIFKKNQRAVVTVQVVVKMKFSVPGMGGQANESKQDVTGTVMDPSGLTVLALSSCEPGDLLQGMMAGMSDEDTKFKMETELSDVKLLLDDGTELPADIVLRDKDLDLAFVRPVTKPASPMTALDLSKSATAQVLEQVITLNRLGKAAGRAYAASVERISAVVQKPRLFYVPGSEMTSTTLGSPAFSLDGTVLGVFVMRSVSQKSGGMGMFSFRPQGLTTIILPAADILKAARQVPEAKTGDEKKEEPKETKDKK